MPKSDVRRILWRSIVILVVAALALHWLGWLRLFQMATVTLSEANYPIPIDSVATFADKSTIDPCSATLYKKKLNFQVYHKACSDLTSYKMQLFMNWQLVYIGRYQEYVNVNALICDDELYYFHTVLVSPDNKYEYLWAIDHGFYIKNRNRRVTIKLLKSADMDTYGNNCKISVW